MSGSLFACSKCFTRHPFDELSPGQQLCKECRGSFPIVKCTYCRSEFQQESKSSTVAICKKCESMVKQHGKPSACHYCNVIAAFIGNKCQRCANSERKYGAPLTCDQCKQKCAFDRKDVDKRKVDGKLLCWLCTLSYRRALAKTKVTDPARHSHVKLASRSHHHHHHHREDKKYQPVASLQSTKTIEAQPKVSGHNKRPSRPDVTKLPTDEPSAKVSRSSAPRDNDPNTADQMVLITQLREKIASLEKQLNSKGTQLLGKDRQMTELKAAHYTLDQEMRVKTKTTNREYDLKITILQKKLKEQTREIAQLCRGIKTRGKRESLPPGLGVGSIVASPGSSSPSPSPAPPPVTITVATPTPTRPTTPVTPIINTSPPSTAASTPPPVEEEEANTSPPSPSPSPSSSSSPPPPSVPAADNEPPPDNVADETVTTPSSPDNSASTPTPTPAAAETEMETETEVEAEAEAEPEPDADADSEAAEPDAEPAEAAEPVEAAEADEKENTSASDDPVPTPANTTDDASPASPNDASPASPNDAVSSGTESPTTV